MIFVLVEVGKSIKSATAGLKKSRYFLEKANHQHFWSAI